MDPVSDHDALTRFVLQYRDRYFMYHNHKESMAYAAFALYLVSFGAGLVSAAWPPAWPISPGWLRAIVLVVVATVAWLFALRVMAWQLGYRRLAAVRVAGAERLLNSLLRGPVAEEQLRTWEASKRGQEPAAKGGLKQWLWPPGAPISDADLDDDMYPAHLIAACRYQQHEHPTHAVEHEALVFAAGWVAWALLVIKTAIII
jgi:hypothetical protein